MRRLTITAAVLLAVYAAFPYLIGDHAARDLTSPLAPEYTRDHVPTLAAYRVWSATHHIGGAALTIVGLLQLGRWWGRATHHLLGRLYVGLAFLVAVGGASMAFVAPYGGPAEALPTLVFAGLLLGFTVQGVLCILRGEVEAHRVWMQRSYAVVLGPLLVRLVYMLLWSTGVASEPEAMVPAFWVGWPVPLIVLEVQRMCCLTLPSR